MRNHRFGGLAPTTAASHQYLLDAHGDCVVIALDDASLREGISDLRWRLDHLLADGQPTLVIDISRVSSLSSASVAAMLWAKRRCQARQARVVVRGPSRRSLDLLRRTGLASALEIAPSHSVRDGGSGTAQLGERNL